MCCLPIRQVEKDKGATLDPNQNIVPGKFLGWKVIFLQYQTGTIGRILMSYQDLVAFLDQNEHNSFNEHSSFSVQELFSDGVMSYVQRVFPLRELSYGTPAWRIPCRLCRVGIWTFSIPPEGNRLCDACFKKLAERCSCAVSG